MSRACRAWILLAALCVPALAAARDPGLRIETGSPDALCPDLASTRTAVQRRIGELIVPGGSSGFRATYTISHAPVGSPRDFVHLELYGPEGTLQLSRDLPLEGESCSTMAEVIALVLDRHFRSLLARSAPAGELPPDASPSAAPSSASTTATPEPLATVAAGTADVPVESSARARQRDDVRLIALELGWRSPRTPELGVAALFEAWPHLYVGTALHVGLLSNDEDLAGGGIVSSREASAHGYFAWGTQRGRIRAYGGPGVSLGIERGISRELVSTDIGYRASWAAGLSAGALWLSADGWSFGASGAFEVSVAELGGRFYVDDREVLVPKRVRAWLGMAVGHEF